MRNALSVDYCEKGAITQLHWRVLSSCLYGVRVHDCLLQAIIFLLLFKKDHAVWILCTLLYYFKTEVYKILLLLILFPWEVQWNLDLVDKLVATNFPLNASFPLIWNRGLNGMTLLVLQSRPIEIKMFHEYERCRITAILPHRQKLLYKYLIFHQKLFPFYWLKLLTPFFTKFRDFIDFSCFASDATLLWEKEIFCPSSLFLLPPLRQLSLLCKSES